MKRLATLYILVLMLLLVSRVSSFAALPWSVNSISPANGATGISTTMQVVVVFNQDMNAVTIAGTDNIVLQLSSASGQSGIKSATSITYNATTRTATANFTGLANSTQYDIRLRKWIETASGYYFNYGNLYQGYSFTTAAAAVAPAVSLISPANGTSGIARTTTISATFTEDMDASTLTSANFYLNNGVTPTKTTLDYNSTTKTVTFIPSALLNYGTTYTATITTGVKSSAGLNMASPNYTWSFTTQAPDTTKPTVVAVSPAEGGSEVALNATITAKFSEAIEPTSVTAAGVFTLNNGATGTVSYDPATLTATFTPSAALSMNTVYTARITSAVTDEASNTMATDKVWTFTTTGNYTVTNTPLTNYAQVPPLVTSGSSSLKPNVLLIIDNSGSMYEFAYKSNGKGYDWDHPDSGYDSDTSYYGYFDNTKMYQYETTSGGFFKVNSSAAQVDKTSFWSGNMLNWLTMRRIDVVRKVLVGGKTQPRSANTANYLIVSNDPDRDYYKSYGGVRYIVDSVLRKCSDSNCYSYDDYNMKVYVGDQLPQEGLILKNSDRINFGIMNFNNGYHFEDGYNSIRDGGQVTVDIGSTGTNLITQVENTDPSTWTPLAETLYEAIRYFEATTSAYNGGTYSGKDPLTADCMKNFVLILTDGESTKDQNIPGTSLSGTDAVSSSYGFDIDTFMARIETQEKKDNSNFRWNQNTTDTNSSYYNNYNKLNSSEGTWYLPGVALYAHTKDLRSETVGKSNLAGLQNLTIYSVFAFDDSAYGRQLLKLTSKYGGFENASMTETSVPTTTAQWDKDSDGNPDTYYEASNGAALQTSLQNAFDDILSKVSSGTSASIVNNRGESGANLFQAVFYPRRTLNGKDIYWTGDLMNMWYYIDPLISTSSIREDTDINQKMNLKLDYMVSVDYDTAQNRTVANWYQDTTGKGSFSFVKTGTPESIKALWRAGGLLHYRTADSRTIKTTLSSYNAGYPGSSGLTDFTSASAGTILSSTGAATNNLFNVSNLATAQKVINYTRGVDYLSDSTYRSRTVSVTYPSTAAAPLNTTISDRVWKLGDIVTSTPKPLTAKQLHGYDTAYADSSYSTFYNSADYGSRNTVYTAANDGMLHAFRVGKVTSVAYSSSDPYTMAQITSLDNSLNLGDEEWAFVPKNALPYLKYLSDPNYKHLFYVDNTVVLVDASISKPTSINSSICTQEEYWKCPKQTVYSNTSTKTLNLDETSWRTVLIGGMGLGGASRDYSGFCNKYTGATPNNATQEDRLDCVKSPIPGAGLSSFFALDVTSPNSPKFMWEFSDAALPAADKGVGFATAGPALVRISARTPATNSYGTPNLSNNGRWFAVFATGPSGPIKTDINQFLGRSDNTLKVYVVDLHPNLSSGWVKGVNYWVLDSGHKNAFAGDIANSVVDVDRWNTSASGYYSDDVVYIGYTKAGTDPVTTSTTWTDGGILRLLTNDSLNPADWTLSTMVSGVGPVTTAPTKLQNRKTGKLMVFFGTGRYFYKDSDGVDDPTNRRHLFGVEDVCYNGTLNKMNSGFNLSNQKVGCAASAPTALGFTDLQDQSTTIVSTLPSGKKGWYIALDPAGDYALGAQMTTSAYSAERVTANTTASTSGIVFFTTFKPSDNICSYGGNTLVWAVDYATGGTGSSSAMEGKMTLQLSGGQFMVLDLKTAFNDGGDSSQNTRGNRRSKGSLSGFGGAGSDGGNLQGQTAPIKKILQIMEK